MNSSRENPSVGQHRLGEADIKALLEERLGRAQAASRLAIETGPERKTLGNRRRWFHLENWYSARSLIRNVLRLSGLYGRAQRNARDIARVDHAVAVPRLPPGFAGLRVLHLTDLHIDMTPETASVIIERVRDVDWDLCVLTGDYRFECSGEIDSTLDGMAQLRASLQGPVYAVLGNHDSIRMVPGLERMDIRVLVNEQVEIRRDDDVLYLAGIDDAHFFGVGDIEEALADVPLQAFSILLSHTPEVYRQAARAGVNLMLCGHTHGGQICLPGGFPVTLDARVPRRMGRGAWRFEKMLGYTSPGSGTSIVEARLNCRPEITVHILNPGVAQ